MNSSLRSYVKGITLRYTANIGDDSQFYAMANLYRTDTSTFFTPLGFNGTPTPPRASTVTPYNVLLPVYVCSTGVGTLSGEDTGCDATNGVLNPYNPYAASGQQRAQVLLRSPNGRTVDTETRVMRLAMGFEGSFGNDWRYTTNFHEFRGRPDAHPGQLHDPPEDHGCGRAGHFRLYDPAATPQAIWDYIAPTNETYSPSRLWMVEGNVAKDVAELAGGPLQVAVGLAYRDESIDAPSGNPANDSAPYERYYSINAVGTAGSRDVSSVFFEVDAPVLETLDLIASGGYDDYSSGQTNFSPKVGFKFSPIDSLALRGTWSQGFRIPSFNEAFGLPTTGYVTSSVDCAEFADFCAAHGNKAYATTNYSLGLTQTGDPALDPEESESFTAGVIWQATDNISMTLDYWNIQVDGLIAGVTSTDVAEDQYYANNGVVTIPGITVLPGTPDPAFPNALPLLGFIQSSYSNQNKQEVSGIDFNATVSGIPLGTVDWTTSLELRTSRSTS